MARRTTSEAGLALIASFEGFRAKSQRLPDGRWIVGYGHARAATGPVIITPAEAMALLRIDLAPIEDTLNEAAFAPLSQNQFDALASFAFNIGLDQFRTSDVLVHLNRGEPVAAAMAMDAWRTATVNGRTLVIDALVRRRAAEKALFLMLDDRPVAPSPLLRPGSDPVAAIAAFEPRHEWTGNAAPDSPEVAANDVTPDPQLPLDLSTEPPAKSETGEGEAAEPLALADGPLPQERAAALVASRIETLVAPAEESEPVEAAATEPDAVVPPAETPSVQSPAEPAAPAAPVEATAPEPEAADATPPPFPTAPEPDAPPVPVETAPASAPPFPQTGAEPTPLTVGSGTPTSTAATVAAARAALSTKSAPVITPNEETDAPPSPDRTPQGIIMVIGAGLLLIGLLPGIMPGESNSRLLLAVAGACFLVVGGYYALRPPARD